MRRPARKAQGMSLNVIIIAVIGIAILVILLFMVVGRTRIFGGAMSSCESKGGECLPECTAAKPIEHYGTDCGQRHDDGDTSAKGPKCCASGSG